MVEPHFSFTYASLCYYLVDWRLLTPILTLLLLEDSHFALVLWSRGSRYWSLRGSSYEASIYQLPLEDR